MVSKKKKVVAKKRNLVIGLVASLGLGLLIMVGLQMFAGSEITTVPTENDTSTTKKLSSVKSSPKVSSVKMPTRVSMSSSSDGSEPVDPQKYCDSLKHYMVGFSKTKIFFDKFYIWQITYKVNEDKTVCLVSGKSLVKEIGANLFFNTSSGSKYKVDSTEYIYTAADLSDPSAVWSDYGKGTVGKNALGADFVKYMGSYYEVVVYGKDKRIAVWKSKRSYSAGKLSKKYSRVYDNTWKHFKSNGSKYRAFKTAYWRSGEPGTKAATFMDYGDSGYALMKLYAN